MTIDRKALVTRHNVRLTHANAESPLSVGNGEFAFTADITGLQTFPDFYRQGLVNAAARLRNDTITSYVDSMQLGTQAQWGWHTMPNPNGYHLEQALTAYPTARGAVTYPDRFDFKVSKIGSVGEATSAGEWLYDNPQRIDLGQIGLELRRQDGSAARIEDLVEVEQELNLWQGCLQSAFRFDGKPVQVVTVCHPERDLLAVRIESPLVVSGQIAVSIAFPYASTNWLQAADWKQPDRHTTQHEIAGKCCTFTRRLDEDGYYAILAWTGEGELLPMGKHQYQLRSLGSMVLEFTICFAPTVIIDQLPTFGETREAAVRHWVAFWMKGGAVDLSASTDPRAPELERRLLLSQYLTAINCAGSTPPQETGLVCNSWHGKFHLEMHWWHAAHFALWGREQLLERSLPWYLRILPQAQATARRQGYAGARWPKEIGPDGREAPNQIGPFLVWQQPHPIYYAELLWRAHLDQATLERYHPLVMETAAFMAAFPIRKGEHYHLDAPLMPAQESYDRSIAADPTFELAYWYWGLETAQRWRERLGLPRDEHWERVKNGLVRPLVKDGSYAAVATPPYTVRVDHPSMVGALGVVPQTPLIDPDTMRATLHSIQQHWQWETTWGWDYPMLAMCAARLGQPDDAVDFLLMNAPKNVYLANGHNRQAPTMLPLYLPGNGGLLMAVAMMAAGWDDCWNDSPTRAAPGFPAAWQVQVEGIRPMP